MNQSWSLRGHFHRITTINPYKHTLLITADDNGWLIVWNLLNRRCIACWKAHDSSIITIKLLLDDYLLTHSKDGEIKFWFLGSKIMDNCLSSELPDVSFDSINVLQKTEYETLLRKYPQPKFNSVPVNNLNYCNIDFNETNNLLVTPATLDANNFDIYRINYLVEDFKLTRLVQNFNPWPAVKKNHLDHGDDNIEEINPTKRDGLGIMMKIKFLANDTFFIGYESGYLLGFKLTFPEPNRITASSANVKENLMINRDPKVTLIYMNDYHIPNPILSLECHNNSLLFVGATLRFISVHNIEKYVDNSAAETSEHDFQHFNLKYSGIQSIQIFNDKVLIGFWNGTIKSYDFSFNQLDKFLLKLPNLTSLKTNEANNDETIESNVKLSTLQMIRLDGCLEDKDEESHGGKYKKMILHKKFKAPLLMAGYSDGKLLAIEVK